MTEAEFTSLREQVTQLQQQSESRTKAWQSIGRLCRGLAVFLASLAAAFILSSLWLDAKSYPTTHQFVTIMGYQFLFTSVPLIMLGQALRTP